METENEVMEKPTKIELKTSEDWEYFFTNYLANKNCNKCYGKGFIGRNILNDNMPVGCTAKGCSIHNLKLLQRQQQIADLKRKQDEKKVKVENVSTDSESTI
jgi:hypothetical protein